MSTSQTIPASRAAVEAYWSVFAEQGPRHAAMARWVNRYGWNVSDDFARSWLAPEMKRPNPLDGTRLWDNS